jgi:hypothetical protein
MAGALVNMVGLNTALIFGVLIYSEFYGIPSLHGKYSMHAEIVHYKSNLQNKTKCKLYINKTLERALTRWG